VVTTTSAKGGSSVKEALRGVVVEVRESTETANMGGAFCLA
jgi:hypothetical protein